MDVLDEGKLHSQVVEPAITRLNTETVPAIEKALSDQIEHAAKAIMEGVVRETLAGLNAEFMAAVAQVEGLIDSLDGWTVEIGPITVPPISIRLTKPKEQK